jgi:hypothetical protein
MKHIKLFEQFISEAKAPSDLVKLGAKANKFNSIIDEWDWFTDVDSTDEGLPKEYHNGLKKLRINTNNAIVVFSGAVGSWYDILSAAKKAGIKYVEVDDEETGEAAIIFDGTK